MTSGMYPKPEGVVPVEEILLYLEQDRYLTKLETTRYLSLGLRTLESRLSEIPHFRVGGKILFRKSELDHYMEKHRELSNDSDLERIADEAVKAVLGVK